MTLYVDMDGVLADFDAGFERAFGYKPDKIRDNVPWDKVREIEGFYENLPPMDGAHVLWEYVSYHSPKILTGVPSDVPEAPMNKIKWVKKWISPHVEVITCKSRDKSLYCSPNDILIDDWEKHKQKWIDKGGVWITHVNADDTIRQLKEMYL